MNERLRFDNHIFGRRAAASRRKALAAALAAAVIVPFLAGGALAEPVYRNGWLPNNDPSGPHVDPADDTPGLAEDYHLKGDVWTLSCPKGSKVTLFVDTKADRNDGKANVDPHTWVFDSKGRLVDEGDDEIACTHEPVCGYRCTRNIIVECSDKLTPYTLAIADGGPTKGDVGGPNLCIGGGGYRLIASAELRGKDVSDEVVLGGLKAKLPDWLASAIPSRRPLIDDGDIPFKLE